MPELPEVETIARQLRARGVEGCIVKAVDVRWAPTVEPLCEDAFSAALVGEVIEEISRYGKWMMIRLGSGAWVMIHLRMSGSFSLEPGTHDRLVLELEKGPTLYYRDSRKFGRWRLVDDPQAVLAKLGPDALTKRFSRAYFADVLARRGRGIKAVLLDQSVVAGLGNIYVDEALWEAQIHPETPANALEAAAVERLFKAVKHVLRVGVKNRGTSLGTGKTNYRDLEGSSGEHRAVVKAYGRAGCSCERCGAVMVKAVIAQRGTTFCPVCQLVVGE